MKGKHVHTFNHTIRIYRKSHKLFGFEDRLNKRAKLRRFYRLRFDMLEDRNAPASVIHVAVLGTGSDDSGMQAIVNQLNDHTYFNFDADLIQPSNVTASLLSNYDAAVIGNSGSSLGDSFNTFAGALATWVNGGGGLVSTGAILMGADRAVVDALVPVPTSPGAATHYPPGNVVSISGPAHAVTVGVASFAINQGPNYIEAPYGFDGGGTVLGTTNGAPTIVAANVAQGRSVYLGLIYAASTAVYNTAELRSGNADRLLEQAVAWASHPLTVVNDSFSVSMNTSTILLPVLLNDTGPVGDALTITSVTQGSHGTVTIAPMGTDVFYSPQFTFVGTDSFTYTVADTRGNIATATVNVDVAAPASAVIHVAVLGTGDDDSGMQAIVNQLNDHTYFNFDADLIQPGSVSASLLSNYDVAVIGNSGNPSGDSFNTFAAALATWVNGGGGLVATGPILMGADRAVVDALVPVPTSPGAVTYYPPGNVVSISGPAHAVTAGVVSFAINQGPNYIEAPYGFDGGGTMLGTTNGAPTIVAGNVGQGRSVYLGPLYSATTNSYTTAELRSGNADRLLEQAVAWAGPTVAISTPVANGAYAAGAFIPIEVTFSQTVIVTGTPQLTLNTGAVVNYVGGSVLAQSSSGILQPGFV